MKYETECKNAVTGEITFVPWTEEEIAAFEAQQQQQLRERVPASITRRQCALQLLAMEVVTPAEALAMTKTGEVPAAVAAVFATMPEDQRILAEIDFAAANYCRTNPLLSMMGLTEEQVDQFFIAAAQL